MNKNLVRAFCPLWCFGTLLLSGLSLRAQCLELVCPTNVTVTLPSGSNCVPLSYTAVATNTCNGTNLTVTYSPASGTCFDVGTNAVQVTAVGSGQTNTCSFTVTVLPSTNCLGYVCPTNLVVYGPCGVGCVAFSNYPPDFATNYCNPADLQVVYTLLPSGSNVTAGECFPVGTNQLVLTVSGSGQTNTCPFTLTIVSTNCPSTNCLGYVCPTNLVVYGLCGVGCVTFSNYPPSFATNYCNPSDLQVTYTLLPSGSNVTAGECFPVGTNQLVLTVSGSGQTNTCPFTLTIVSTNCPATNCLGYVCPTNLVVYGPCGVGCVAFSNYPPDFATNYCNPADLQVVYTLLPSGSNVTAGECFPVGTNQLVLTVSGSGQTNTCPFTLTIVSTNCPATNCLGYVCPTNLVVYGPCGVGCVTFSNYPPSFATNYCNPADLQVTYTLLPSGSNVTAGECFPVGTNQLVLTVSGSGQTNTCPFTLTIVSTNCPSTNCLGYVCPTNLVVYGACGVGCVTFSNYPPSFATNYCNPSDLQVTYTLLPSGSNVTAGECFPVGTNQLVLTVSGSGQTNTCPFTLTIVSTNCPATNCLGYVCPTNLVVYGPCGVGCVTFSNYPPSFATNYCNPADLQVVYTLLPSGSNVTAGECFPVGTNQLVLTVSGSGQTNTCPFTLTIVSTNCPSTNCLGYVCPTNLVVYGLCGVGCVTFSNYPPSFGTNYCNPSDLQVTYTLLPSGSNVTAGECFPVGTNQLVLTVSGSGQTNTCPFTLTIVSTNCPATNCLGYVCPTNLVVYGACGVGCVTFSNYPPSFATNYCDPADLQVTYTLLPSGSNVTAGECFPVGTNQLVLTVSGSGQTNTCPFTLTIVSTNCPATNCLGYVCPTNLVVYGPCGVGCVTFSNYPPSFATNYCNPADLQVTYTLLPSGSNVTAGECFPVGTNQLVLTVSGSGQTNTCPFTLTIVSTNCPATNCLGYVRPTNLVVYGPCGVGCVTFSNYPPSFATNYCNPADLQVTYTLLPSGSNVTAGECFPVGTNQLVLTVSGSGQTNTCPFTLTIVSTNCPATNCLGYVCPTNLVVYGPCGVGCVTFSNYPPSFATNYCNPADLQVTYTLLPSGSNVTAGECFPVGTNQLVLTVSGSGQTNTCPFTLTIVSTNCPSTNCLGYVCPTNLVVYGACGLGCVAFSNYPPAFATNYCNPADLQVTYTLLPSGSNVTAAECFPVGTNQLVLTVSGSGQTNTCPFTLTIVSTNCSCVPGESWVQTTAPVETWAAVASSADGTHLVAVDYTGGIYTSADRGEAWSLTSAPDEDWTSVASSADGTQLVAVVYDGGIYTSTDSGGTWSLTSAPDGIWISVASSANGTQLVAVVYKGGIYTSTNGGGTWTKTTAPAEGWQSVASSADGTHLIAAVYGGGIYTSTNSGVTWTAAAAPTENWQSVASSADGTHLVAAAYEKGIYISTNSGATWIATGALAESWQSVASSADGTHLVAVAYNNGIYTSADSGGTWSLTSAPRATWFSVASSADGSQLVAAAVIEEGIYVSDCPSTNCLGYVCPTNLVVYGACGMSCVTFSNYPPAFATNYCNPADLQVVYTLLPSGSNVTAGECFPVGTNQLVLTVSGSGQTNTCPFTLTIVSTNCPSTNCLGYVCPTNLVVYGLCGVGCVTFSNYPPSFATNYCNPADLQVVYTLLPSGSNVTAGECFPVGTNQLVLTVSGSGQTNTCPFTLTIVSTNCPSTNCLGYVCPTNLVVYGLCGVGCVTFSNYPPSFATNYCNPADLQVTYTLLPSGSNVTAGECFPVGTNQLVLTVSGSGQTNTCPFTLTIVSTNCPATNCCPISISNGVIPGTVVISWPCGALQSSTTVNGSVPYTDVPGAASPYTTSIVNAPPNVFYRTRCN